MIIGWVINFNETFLLFLSYKRKKMENEIIKERKITPKDPESRWVAIDIITDVIISEGKTPEEATEKANKTGKTFSLMFVPKSGQNYIL